MPKARKMLSDWNTPYIQSLMKLIETQSKATLTIWAVAYNRLGTDAPWGQIEQCAAEECGRMEAALRDVAVENEPNLAKIDWKC